MTAAAVIQSPQIAELTTEPARNYELSVDLVLNEKPYHIDYSWKCEQEKVFTASTMQWVLRWQSEFKIVAKRFPDDVVIYFWQPSFAYCQPESSTYVPRIVVASETAKHEAVKFFNAKYEEKTGTVASSIVKQGNIRRVVQPSSLGAMSPQEEALALSLTRNIEHYVARKVVIFPIEVWSESAALQEILSKITKTTRAIDLPHPKMGDSIFIFSATNGLPSSAYTNAKVRNFIPELKDGKLNLGNAAQQSVANLFRYESDRGAENQAQFCYQNECLSLKGTWNQIYYPSSSELVDVSKGNLKPWFHN